MQIEAVENHMPEVVIVDEVGTEAEALACRSIAERGVQLVATAHGRILENIIKNPTLCDLVGGIQSVTLGRVSSFVQPCLVGLPGILHEPSQARSRPALMLNHCCCSRFPAPFHLAQASAWTVTEVPGAQRPIVFMEQDFEPP